MLTWCRRVHCHVYGAALNGSINWPWSDVSPSGPVSNQMGHDRLPKKDRAVVTEKLEEDWLALLTEKIASKVWTTTKWAIYEGDVPITLALRSIFWGGERPRGGEAGPPGAWLGTRLTLHVGSINLSSTACEGNDWIKLMAERQPCKENVIHSLLASSRGEEDRIQRG